jgi:hypothetical protein
LFRLRSDDQENGDGQASRYTRSRRKHLAAVAARPIDACRAACRNQSGIEFG